jgi:psp operon transcriptional activator
VSEGTQAVRQQQEQQLIGESPGFLAVLEHVSRIAPLDRPVLVIGERGTGKELIAARIHYLSARWDKPFVKLNCAALTESLLESELFGHEAGSFTGANKRRAGRFELAHHGSLFLDELASTSSRVQEKILRVIEYGEFERVGGTETLTTDVRLIGATNEDLPRLADEGKFRADLLDRLAFDVITLPPLRERREDILPLAEHFAVRMAGELGHELFPGFDETARQDLMEYPWPGNVRELKNVIERAVILSRGNVLRLEASLPEAATNGPDAAADALAEPEFLTEQEMREFQKKNTIAALEQADWRVSGAGGAADLLGIKPTTLADRIRTLGIRKPGKRGRR